LIVTVALHAGFAALQRPAFESLIQQIIPDELMSPVAALNSLRYSIGAIISPSIAGMIARFMFSATALYAIDLITFAATLDRGFYDQPHPDAENADDRA
jgi:hypothetical protein